MKKNLSLLSLLIGMIFIFGGCAKTLQRCTDVEDNPRHHYLMGMELLDQDKNAEAFSKFERARYCDDGFGPAHGGLAIVDARKAAAAKDRGYKKADSQSAMEHLKMSYKNASAKEDEFAYHLASMRTRTILKGKGWLNEAEDDFKEASRLKVNERKLTYYDGTESAAYFMGMAYLEAREFQSARDRFNDVLSARREGKWMAPADKAWKKTDKIVRALAGITLGDVGKEIAIKDSVKRGDMAALLADELKINKIFAGRIPAVASNKMNADFIPADLMESKFKEEALMMLKWGIRGLEPVYDKTTKANLFKPEEPVTRKEFAFIVEDLLIKITGDEKMATAYFGHEKSPFPDVPAASAWYNAIMNVTVRNIMENELSGEFRPNDNVDGAEAVLALRVLKQRLNIY
ncbi:MAG: S-layer homology domain-containing protein [Deltaproteobacteria bacterium]|nr:S-layer homology domain-containing protein [Deltaproteobacteria bacterium]